MLKLGKSLIVLLLASMLSACATAPGQKFTGVVTPASDQCDIYLYRASSISMVGRAFDVSLDGKPVGKLFNASYLQMRVPAGQHKLTVIPGGVGKNSDIQVEAKPGQTMFFQYNFITGLLTNIFFAGSNIEPRDQERALQDLKELTAANK